MNSVKPTVGNAIAKTKRSRGKPSSSKRLKTRINSRQKGAQGERDFAEVLRAWGYAAKRGQQHAGGVDAPDVITNVPGVHFEVKRVQAGNPYVWLAQAIRDAASSTAVAPSILERVVPVVAHRRNGQDWIAVLRMDDLLKFIQGSEGPL